VIDRVIRGCQRQSIELANWPFGTIAKVVAPDQNQSAALDQLRLAAQRAADRRRAGQQREASPPRERGRSEKFRD
jgi:hypothetical protein